jgi:hypothetical protein
VIGFKLDWRNDVKNPFWMFRSRLGWLNFFVLQWFFVRLQEVGDRDAEGNWKHLRWEFLWAPLPLTGWWGDYIFLVRGGVAKRTKLVFTKKYLLKQRILRILEKGPQSAYTLERLMREGGIDTPRVMRCALTELVDEGNISVMAHEKGKPWLYRKTKRTIGA